MDNPSATPPVRIPRAGGQVVGSLTFNKSMDAIERLVPVVAGPQQVNYPAPPFSGFLRGQRFKVVSILPDYLICNTWDGITLGTEQIYVAKPITLRGSVTSWNSIVYTAYGTDGQSRTSTLSGNVDSEVVVRAWIAGDEVWASAGYNGGTGVTYVDSAGVTQNALWLAEADGRMWSKKTGT